MHGSSTGTPQLAGSQKNPAPPTSDTRVNPQPTARRPNRSDSPPAATITGMPGSPATTSMPAAADALRPRSVWRKSSAKVWACWDSCNRKAAATTNPSHRA
jgi:hypothetical protein